MDLNSQMKTEQENTEKDNTQQENTEQGSTEQNNTAQENTAQEKPEQTKKGRGRILSAVCSVIVILLTLLLDYLVVQTAGGLSALPKKVGEKKELVLAVMNFLVIGTALFGDRVYERIEKRNRVLVKALEWAALLVLPVLVFYLVQRVMGGAYLVETEYLPNNLLIYYWLFLIFLLLIPQVSFACFSYSLILLMLALVEYFVYRFRSQAFTLLDILNVGTAMTVVEGYSFRISVKRGMLLLLFLFILAFQIRMQKLTFGKKRGVRNFGVRVCGLLLLGGAAYFGRGFYLDSDNCYLWHLHSDYRKKGYVYTLAKEIRYLKNEKPEGYSSEQVEALAEELTESEQTESKGTESEQTGSKQTESEGTSQETQTIVPENIILIMNESFADFSTVGEIAADEDVLANYHALQNEENVIYGGLSVPVFGAGTSQTEYEVLTGNSVSFQSVGSIAYQLYTKNPEYGMAASLKAQGYTTVAVHPNRPSAWSRQKVYANMQFDRFISIKDWEIEPEVLRGKVSDENAYEQLIKLYEDKEESEKLFLFCVTIQNHGGYRESTLNGFEPTVELSYDKNYTKAEIYLSLLKESDTAFEQLIDYFRDVEEPTMIAMFGDHWPSLEEGFYTQLFGKEYESLNTEELQERFTTPYIIWTNYSSETGTEDMSANYFGAYLTSLAGLELTPYQEFLLEMKEDIPVVSSGTIKTADGEWISTDALTGETAEWMDNYQILEYNNVFDRQNRVDELFSLE